MGKIPKLRFPGAKFHIYRYKVSPLCGKNLFLDHWVQKILARCPVLRPAGVNINRHFTQHRWDIDKVIMWPMYSKRAGTLGDRCSIIKRYKKQNKHDNKDTVLTIINATNFVQILHLRSFSKIFDITFRFSFSVVHQWMQHRQKCYNCSTSAIVVIKTNVARFYGTSRSFSL